MKLLRTYLESFFHKQDNYLFPKEIILEVTNHCNLRCRHCHFHADTNLQKRKLEFMEPHVWKRVLDELKKINRPVNLMTHGAGEPLLYKPFFDLLIAAKKISSVSTGFMTNGMLLDKAWTDRLVDMQLDFLAFSVDGVDAKSNDYFRVKANLHKIEENIQYLIERKIKTNSDLPKLSFNMVGYPPILDQEMAYVKKWIPVAQSVTISTFRPIGSRKLWENTENIVPLKPCPLLWNQLVVSVDGKVGLCCEDINLNVPIGDLNLSTIKKIFNKSSKLQHYRKKHLSHNLSGLELCQDCHSWAGDSILDKKEILMDGVRVNFNKTPAFTTYTKI